jgi:hypothetical protein
MYSLVLVKVSDLDEGLLTFLALIWFLPRMNPLMNTEGLPMAEGFATCTTLIRFLSSVTSPVTNKG